MEPTVYGFCQSPSYVDVRDEYISYKNRVSKKYTVLTSINQSTGKVQ